MQSDEAERRRPSAAILAAGIDHVRLLYHYIDTWDMDGYGSLLDDDVRLWSPGAPVGRGRAEVIGLQQGLAGPPARHETHEIIASGDKVAVVGRHIRPARDRSEPPETVEFADFFTLTEDAMLLTHHRYYFIAPDR
jgi:ketosteroid isomerase-like protein